MSAPQLWVWIGSPDDQLDVLRYVKATERDILRQPAADMALHRILSLIGQTLGVAAEEIETMPDFAGRTADQEHGGMEGVLRSEAAELLRRLDPAVVLDRLHERQGGTKAWVLAPADVLP